MKQQFTRGCIFLILICVIFFRNHAALSSRHPRFLVTGYKILKRYYKSSADYRNPSQNHEQQTYYAVTEVPF
jgi:hypothetical protein